MKIMQLKSFLFIILIVFFYSCGSQKNTTASRKVVNQRKDNRVRVPVSKEKEIESKDVVVREPEVNKPVTRIETTRPTNSGDKRQDYILKFADKAVDEMHKHKIPASITLAQGVLESGSGSSELALKSNNHFGIKCHKGWNGSSVSHDDDAKGECFRKYQDPKKSYEDHSLFLTSRKRYASLFNLSRTDYTGWAYGLKKAGYATDPKYPQKLITIINKYNLHEYDLIKSPYADSSSNNVTISNPSSNSYYTVIKGDTLYSIARKNQISVEKLKQFNGLTSNDISIGQKLIIN